MASQANLAVDNALSRLIHNPVIRALRKGKAERVEEEGLPFLEERVIGTWLENTSADCSSRLSMRLDTVQMFHQLLTSSARFAAYLKTEEAFQKEQPLLQERKAVLESEYQAKVSTYQQALDEQREVESLKADLDALLAGRTQLTNSVNWEEPATVNLLARLQPYAARESSIGSFEADARIAIRLAAELGMVPPNLSSFGLADWLRDRFPTWFAEVQRAIACASGAATAMTKALPAIQAYRESCDSLTRLQETHQQVLESQQSDWQEIEKLKKQRSEINSAIIQLENSYSKIYANIYGELEKCVQERQPFTGYSIQLPPKLNDIAIEFDHVVWEQHLAFCQEFNDLVNKSREWDRASIIAIELELLLLQQPSKLDNLQVSENHIKYEIGKFGLVGLNSVQALKRLSQVAHHTLEEVNQPPSFFSRINEKINGYSHLYYLKSFTLPSNDEIFIKLSVPHPA